MAGFGNQPFGASPFGAASAGTTGLTLTATPEPAHVPPRVRLDVADSDGTVTSVVITRLDADGRSWPVRTEDGGALVVSGGVATVWDYEVPYGTTVTYSTDVFGGPTVAVSLDVAEVWLVHPGVPSRSTRLPVVVDIGERLRTVNQGTFVVLRRSTPVIVSGGARSAPSGTLTVRTHTEAERLALEMAVADAQPLFLDVPAGNGWGLDSAYVVIGDLTEARTLDYAPFPWREWAMPYQVVARPGGGTQAAITWDDVAKRGADDYTAANGSQYQTWQDVANGAASWAELAAPTS